VSYELFLGKFRANTYDGTTDGVRNYTVQYFPDNFATGAVLATATANWSSPISIVFSTGNLYDLGITYDRTNNSLWILNYDTGIITDYTMAGTPISSFATGKGFSVNGVGSVALAMDVDHTLWFSGLGTGNIYHFATDGTFLGQAYYSELGQAYGGEIGFSTATPEPATFLVWGGLCFAGLFTFRKRLRTRRGSAGEQRFQSVPRALRPREAAGWLCFAKIAVGAR
jgi:hypothetical protein